MIRTRRREPLKVIAQRRIGGVIALAQRAQPGLFPEASPCGRHGSPVSRYVPPDSFCRGAEGELRTVNGPDAKLLFWTVAHTTVATAIAAVFVRHRRRA
ncbi:hypothetical protein ACWEWK_17705 [Streptomyces sp. NPDC003757]